MCLGEATTVAQLIMARSMINTGYTACDESLNAGEYSASESKLDEHLICLYADLDTLLEEVDFTQGQGRLVDRLMEGYTLSDVAMELGVSKQSVHRQLQRIVLKIITTHQTRWQRTQAK